MNSKVGCLYTASSNEPKVLETIRAISNELCIGQALLMSFESITIFIHIHLIYYYKHNASDSCGWIRRAARPDITDAWHHIRYVTEPSPTRPALLFLIWTRTLPPNCLILHLDLLWRQLLDIRDGYRYLHQRASPAGRPCWVSVSAIAAGWHSIGPWCAG